ncbi:MAG: WD40/YVTN/BNR-like repeat-containing protein, partial [Planctomycetota bacterium JB042]
GFFSSEDRGETWTQSNLYHQRINRLLAISPAFEDDGLVLVGNYGGGPMFWDERTDEWSVRADGIRSLYCGILTPSPAFADDRTIFYGYMGTWRSDDAGATWTQITPYDAITRSIAISPEFAEDGFVILNRAQAGTWRSNDRGDTWTEVTGLPKGRVNELAVSPGFPADPVVYAAPAQEGLFVSTDGGESFAPLAGALDGANVRTLALSPDFGRDGVILAGTVDHGLFRSEDRGETFVRVDTPSGEEDTLESLAFSPAFGTDGVVYAVSLYDGVLASVDGGRSFRPRNAGLPHDAKRMIAVSPAFARDRTLYVSTHAWTWRSTNGAGSWEILPGHLRVDDHHHTVERTGSWRVEYLPDDFAGGTNVSDQPGAIETFRFYGRTVTWFARVDRDCGAAAVHLDGQFVRLVDLHGSERATNRPVFSHTFDAPGWHRIDVRVTGKKHPGSKGFAVHSDGYAHDF